jgi:hypothetical protein
MRFPFNPFCLSPIFRLVVIVLFALAWDRLAFCDNQDLTNGTSPPDVIVRLIANASKKPPGPVEKDVTSQTMNRTAAAKKGFNDSRSVREIIAGEYNKCTLEGPLTSLYSEGPAAILSGKVKMTPDALAEWKADPPSSSVSLIVGGKVVSTNNEITPSFGEIGGCDLLESKVRDDGHVMATFCLVQQHGLWKVHCVYLSNDSLNNDAMNFIVQQLVNFSKKS